MKVLNALGYSLANKTDRFDARIHKNDARKFGLDVGDKRARYNPVDDISRRAEGVRVFLQKPLPEKIVVAAEGWQSFADKTKDVVFFIPDAVLRGFKNAFDVAARPGPLLQIGVEFKTSYSYESARNKRAEKLVSKVKQSEKLTLDDLRGVTLDNLQFVAKGLSDEELGNIRDGLASIIEVNTLAMAAGPWRGFAKEWLEANKKIKSERTQLIEYSSKVFGVSVDEDLEKAHKDDAAADKVEPAAPANDL